MKSLRGNNNNNSMQSCTHAAFFLSLLCFIIIGGTVTTPSLASPLALFSFAHQVDVHHVLCENGAIFTEPKTFVVKDLIAAYNHNNTSNDEHDLHAAAKGFAPLAAADAAASQKNNNISTFTLTGTVASTIEATETLTPSLTFTNHEEDLLSYTKSLPITYELSNTHSLQEMVGSFSNRVTLSKTNTLVKHEGEDEENNNTEHHSTSHHFIIRGGCRFLAGLTIIGELSSDHDDDHSDVRLGHHPHYAVGNATFLIADSFIVGELIFTNITLTNRSSFVLDNMTITAADDHHEPPSGNETTGGVTNTEEHAATNTTDPSSAVSSSTSEATTATPTTTTGTTSTSVSTTTEESNDANTSSNSNSTTTSPPYTNEETGPTNSSMPNEMTQSNNTSSKYFAAAETNDDDHSTAATNNNKKAVVIIGAGIQSGSVITIRHSKIACDHTSSSSFPSSSSQHYKALISISTTTSNCSRVTTSMSDIGGEDKAVCAVNLFNNELTTSSGGVPMVVVVESDAFFGDGSVLNIERNFFSGVLPISLGGSSVVTALSSVMNGTASLSMLFNNLTVSPSTAATNSSSSSKRYALHTPRLLEGMSGSIELWGNVAIGGGFEIKLGNVVASQQSIVLVSNSAPFFDFTLSSSAMLAQGRSEFAQQQQQKQLALCNFVHNKDSSAGSDADSIVVPFNTSGAGGLETVECDATQTVIRCQTAYSEGKAFSPDAKDLSSCWADQLDPTSASDRPSVWAPLPNASYAILYFDDVSPVRFIPDPRTTTASPTTTGATDTEESPNQTTATDLTSTTTSTSPTDVTSTSAVPTTKVTITTTTAPPQTTTTVAPYVPFPYQFVIYTGAGANLTTILRNELADPAVALSFVILRTADDNDFRNFVVGTNATDDTAATIDRTHLRVVGFGVDNGKEDPLAPPEVLPTSEQLTRLSYVASNFTAMLAGLKQMPIAIRDNIMGGAPTIVPVTTTTPAPTSSDDDEKDDNTTAIIIGCVVGGVALLIIIGAVAFLMCKSKEKRYSDADDDTKLDNLNEDVELGRLHKEQV